eukprot:Hpha_TRINITY_DN12677_c0_g1::TRINITY_DN12677_c0_g1_i1::g.49421::m.49421
MVRRRSVAAAFLALASCASAQFGIPAEMLEQMMGGGGGAEVPQLRWPKGVSGETEEKFEWVANTEWQGKTSRIFLAPGGSVEASQGMNECKREGSCAWAANKGQLRILTRHKMHTFRLEGSDAFSEGEKAAEAQGRLDAHEADELKKVSLVGTEKAKRTGKPSVLTFRGVKENEHEQGLIAKDLYAVLGVPENADEKAIKSAYRKMSVKLHPDKRDDKDPGPFNEVRDANEVLSDKDKRAWYDIGGILLVKNMETGMREIESQEALQLAQLDQQVPKGHPMRKQLEAQIKASTPSPNEAKRQLIEKMTNDDEVVEIPIPLASVYEGYSSTQYAHSRMTICRGCRHDPSTEQCKDCGRCPPERRQVGVPGPFPGTISGTKEVEVESKERCRKSPVQVSGLRAPRGVKSGAVIRKTPRLGHQTPGRFPGAVNFVAVHEENKRYRVLDNDLYTVLTLSVAEATFGCVKKWKLFDTRSAPTVELIFAPGEVWAGAMRHLQGLGLPLGSSGRRFGDLYVRVELAPLDAKGATSLTLQSESGKSFVPVLRPEHDIVDVDGRLYRRWDRDQDIEQTKGTPAKGKASSKDEL